MPRDGSGVFTQVAGTQAVSGDTISSAEFNALMADFVEDANSPRPVVAGGTGSNTAAGARTALGAAARGANSDITSLSGLTTALSVAQGGTGGTTQATARTGIGAAARGANSDITSLTGLTTALSVAQGGTGGTTAAAARTNLGASTVGANVFTAADAPAARQAMGAIGSFVWQTAQATTSGTAFDFTGIPSWATEIAVGFQDVSLSGTDDLLIQLGTSGGLVTSGYNSVSGAVSGGGAVATAASNGFVIYQRVASQTAAGTVFIRLTDVAHRWDINGSIANAVIASVSTQAGRVALGAQLTQLRITRTGSDTFDAGAVNIGWR